MVIDVGDEFIFEYDDGRFIDEITEKQSEMEDGEIVVRFDVERRHPDGSIKQTWEGVKEITLEREISDGDIVPKSGSPEDYLRHDRFR